VILSIRLFRTQHPGPVFFSSTGSFPHDWSMIMMWNLFAMFMMGTVFTMIRLRQEESQREIDSLRRMAHAF
jgi:heme exporter protein C